MGGRAVSGLPVNQQRDVAVRMGAINMPTENEQQVISTMEVPRGGWCYAFGIIFPLVYLLAVPRDKQNSFLCFHCIQCLLLFVLWIPFLYWKLSSAGHIWEIGYLLCLAGWLVSWIQATRRKRFHLPVIGSIAERLI